MFLEKKSISTYSSNQCCTNILIGTKVDLCYIHTRVYTLASTSYKVHPCIYHTAINLCIYANILTNLVLDRMFIQNSLILKFQILHLHPLKLFQSRPCAKCKCFSVKLGNTPSLQKCFWIQFWPFLLLKKLCNYHLPTQLTFIWRWLVQFWTN